MITQEQVHRLYRAFGHDIDMFLAIGEEAGEVIGAYCKWLQGRADKPKSTADIAEEMGQLLGCMLTAAHHVGLSAQEIFDSAEQFLVLKAEKLGSR